jgi:SAM-dependent methyltransferase
MTVRTAEGARPSPTGRSPSQVEREVLTTGAGRALLAEVARVESPRPADLLRWRTIAPDEWVSAALRLVGARRRGAVKFSKADAMWLEPTALEQATAEPVARHKAGRFAGADAVVDLCCGIGGDAIALAARCGGVLAVDRDAGMAERTRWNARVYGVGDRLAAVRGRAEGFPLPGGALVHIDPDRRSRPGPRARSVQEYAPGPAFLSELTRTTRGGAIKLGPSSDFEAHFGSQGVEFEVISLGGECKEATAWFGCLASCRRRATVLPAGASWTDADAGGVRPARPVGEIGRFVFDPDPSLIRSGLLDAFAAAHDLARAGSAIDWLTASACVRSPFLTAFEVEAVLPLDRKRLRRLVAERSLGPLEIKTRGIDLRPEQLRGQLRPSGGNPATLLVYGGRGVPGRAILARRVG